uniref:Uncharacterized protein n=1 Tax=Lepeophtheirus salmonis TaxID=72036 RepID=A0A0K2V2V0_LEPSM
MSPCNKFCNFCRFVRRNFNTLCIKNSFQCNQLSIIGTGTV